MDYKKSHKILWICLIGALALSIINCVLAYINESAAIVGIAVAVLVAAYKVFPLPVLRLQPVPMGPGENARILPGLRRTIDTAQKKLSRLNKTGAVRDRFLCILPGIYINFIDFENII